MGYACLDFYLDLNASAKYFCVFIHILNKEWS